MIVLLPPSEGKTPATSGPQLDLADLHFPELAEARRTVLGRLAEVSAGEDALSTLGVGASLGADVERNTHLTEIPCAPALETYTGVLYSALDVAGLPDSVKTRAKLDSVFVSSALFGIVGAFDPIPAYRLAMKTKLADLGPLATWWKKQLSPVLDSAFDDELLVDCRSADYRRSWPGDPGRTLVVNVFTEKNGKRSVVSHNAKHTRGELVGHLLRDDRALPASFEELLARASERWHTEITRPAGRKPGSLDIVLAG